jgi:CheY-like chemotaxis protein
MNRNPLFHPSAGPSPPDEPGQASPEYAQQYPLRILIADDNYINRRVLSLLLQRLGYQADTAENGQDCLASALSATYDLLLLDINMPDVSGIECAEQLRHAGRKFPIVAVTATDPDISRKACLAAGMNDFISKPVRLGDLKRVLRDASLRGKNSLPLTDIKRTQDNEAGERGSSGLGAGHPTLHLAL